MKRLLAILLLTLSVLQAADENAATNGAANAAVEEASAALNAIEEVDPIRSRLELARRMTKDGKHDVAEKVYIGLLKQKLSEKERRDIYMEMAEALAEASQHAKAQQVYGEFARRFPNDPKLPEVLLRQGYLYRDMGLNQMALAKFYSVISTSLNLTGEELGSYQKTVVRAKTEIAETYYLSDKYKDAAQFFTRVLKLDGPIIDRAKILFRLMKCHSALGEWDQAIASARSYLTIASESGDAPEVRYFLAEALKKLNRNSEALEEVMGLLQKQQKESLANPEKWIYWQQRTGRDIANQLAKEGDFTSALQIYLQLVQLDSSPEWQLPIFYQVGLVYESLKQPAAATEMFDKILEGAAAVKADSPAAVSVAEVVKMAKWRKNFIEWEGKTARLVSATEDFRAKPEPAN
ncbi:MAG TPA: tetratricopeptide repeat protein [Methylomirabilota bacterium]|nr:tetratricopeptide repeat protein [Methylomirabilota bacterium]